MQYNNYDHSYLRIFLIIRNDLTHFNSDPMTKTH